MSKDFEIVTDAGETIVVSRNALTHVEKSVTQKVRPGKWRQILSVDSTPPAWAQSVEYDKVSRTAEWVPTQDFTSDFAVASTQVSKEGFDLFEMMSGYSFRNRELVRASKTGLPLDSLRAQAVMDKAETVLDHIAANGTIDGSKQLGNVEGLYNLTGITPEAISATSTAWEDLAFGTVDEQDAFAETVIQDILALERKSEIDTKETSLIDTLVLPLSVKQLFQRTKGRGDMTVAQAVINRAESIRKIVYWQKGEDKGAAGVRRIACINGRDSDASRFVLPQSPVSGRRVQTMAGVNVPVNMVIGGFQTKIPESVIYADMADAS